jgi:hypothetical protein
LDSRGSLSAAHRSPDMADKRRSLGEICRNSRKVISFAKTVH